MVSVDRIATGPGNLPLTSPAPRFFLKERHSVRGVQMSDKIYNPITGKTIYPFCGYDAYGFEVVDVCGVRMLTHDLAWRQMRGRLPEGPKVYLNGHGWDNQWRNIGHELKAKNRAGITGLTWIKHAKAWRVYTKQFKNKVHAVMELWKQKSRGPGEAEDYIFLCLAHGVHISCKHTNQAYLCGDCLSAIGAAQIARQERARQKTVKEISARIERQKQIQREVSNEIAAQIARQERAALEAEISLELYRR